LRGLSVAGDGLPYDDIDDEDDDAGALDFLAVDPVSGGAELDEPAAETEPDEARLETGADEESAPLFAVTNPPGTVTVSTYMDGRVQQIDLAPKVATMTESDLSEEILVIARLATQEAKSAQYAYMLDGMRRQGHDDVATRDFLTRDLDLPSPQDAEAERADVFATRYRYDHE
jgi:hypothetical protein